MSLLDVSQKRQPGMTGVTSVTGKSEGDAEVTMKEEQTFLRTMASVRRLLTRLGTLSAGYDKVHFAGGLPGSGLGGRGGGVPPLMVQSPLAANPPRVVMGKLSSI